MTRRLLGQTLIAAIAALTTPQEKPPKDDGDRRPYDDPH